MPGATNAVLQYGRYARPLDSLPADPILPGLCEHAHGGSQRRTEKATDIAHYWHGSVAFTILVHHFGNRANSVSPLALRPQLALSLLLSSMYAIFTWSWDGVYAVIRLNLAGFGSPRIT